MKLPHSVFLLMRPSEWHERDPYRVLLTASEECFVQRENEVVGDKQRTMHVANSGLI